MAMLRTCGAAGCTTKTLGELCIDHEIEQTARVSPGFESQDAQPRKRTTPDSAMLLPAGKEGR